MLVSKSYMSQNILKVNNSYFVVFQIREGIICFCFLFFGVFFGFLGPHPQHKEVPRLGVEPDLYLLTDTTAAAMPDP